MKKGESCYRGAFLVAPGHSSGDERRGAPQPPCGCVEEGVEKFTRWFYMLAVCVCVCICLCVVLLVALCISLNCISLSVNT